ncbi:MAG: hypothetical protein ABR520_11305 [Mycobacteriales bacterium]|nr:hypothetical protein [Actinomycetota bacterium]
MRQTLIDLFTSKKFLTALTAVIVYLAGRFGFDVDTAVLDRVFAAFLVYIGAQGVADHGKSAAEVQFAAFRTPFGVPTGLMSGAAMRDSAGRGEPKDLSSSPPRDPQAGFVALWIPAGLVIAGFVALFIAIACTAAQRTATPPAVVDCTAASSTAIASAAASMRAEKPEGCAVAGVTDWHCVENKAIAAGVAIGGCAFLEVAMAADQAPAAVAPVDPRPGRAAFESYRASVAGGAQFRTTSGLR